MKLLTALKGHHTPISDGLMTTKGFRDPEKAWHWVNEIHHANITYLRHAFDLFSQGHHCMKIVCGRIIPYVSITTTKGGLRSITALPTVSSRSPGTYSTTLTRPDLYQNYLLEQFTLLLTNHPQSELEVGVSDAADPAALRAWRQIPPRSAI